MPGDSTVTVGRPSEVENAVENSKAEAEGELIFTTAAQRRLSRSQLQGGNPAALESSSVNQMTSRSPWSLIPRSRHMVTM